MSTRAALANALENIRRAAVDGIVQTNAMARTDRERALAQGWLHPIIKGWYMLATQSAAAPGSTVLWYSHYWAFLRQYLTHRFNDEYCLSAEASLDRHLQCSVIPEQMIVMTGKGAVQKPDLPLKCSLLLYPDKKNLPRRRVVRDGLQVMSLVEALTRTSEHYFKSNPQEAELALRSVDDNGLSRHLIEQRAVRPAGRLAGAFEAIGEPKRARRIREDLKPVVGSIPVSNPFEHFVSVFGQGTRVRSPHVARLKATWKSFRKPVVEAFPEQPKRVATQEYLAAVDDIYQHDAYNSLSIEGYRVTPEIINKVREGSWEPDNPDDRQHIDAMAAKGYWEAFQKLRQAVAQVLEGAPPARVAEDYLQDWYRALFGPSVAAGILKPEPLAGYRNRPVFINGSRHVPPASETLMDCMETYFELLADEESAAVRAVLGHFVFVYIHPYPDGNGRLGRFVMNLMLASGGYPWTVIRLQNRTQYMQALEQASVHKNIKPFAQFIAQEMQVDWKAQTRETR